MEIVSEPKKVHKHLNKKNAYRSPTQKFLDDLSKNTHTQNAKTNLSMTTFVLAGSGGRREGNTKNRQNEKLAKKR